MKPKPPKKVRVKRKYDSEDSRRRLLKAGMEVFSKEGYEGATTRKIAKRAGVNDSLIARYFKNKEGLFFAILRDFHKGFAFSLETTEDQTLEEAMLSFFRARSEYSRKVRQFTRIGITRAIVDAKVRREMGVLIRHGNQVLLTRLESLKKEGKIRNDVDLERLSTQLTGISFSMNMYSGVIFDLESAYTDSVLDQAAKILSLGLKG